MTPATTYNWGQASADYGLDEPGSRYTPPGAIWRITINDADQTAQLLTTINVLYGTHALRN